MAAAAAAVDPDPDPVPTKGMTMAEQTALFTENVTLKMNLGEVLGELVSAKAGMAKAEWQREHDRFYYQSRNRIMHRILSTKLTAADQQRVAAILAETEEYYEAQSTPSE